MELQVKVNMVEVDNDKDLDVVVMSIYSLIEYRNNYSKTSGRLKQHCGMSLHI